MATSCSDIITKVDLIIRDTTNNSVSQADRLDAITEAVRSLYNDFEFDFTNKTFTLNYLDGIYYYNITTDVPDFQEPVDLRRAEALHSSGVVRKPPREFATEIVNGPADDMTFTVEHRDRKTYLGINHNSQYPLILLHSMDVATRWVADAVNSDATNVTLDEVEFTEGSGSINFDADVSQSGNNRITISNSSVTAADLSDFQDLGSLVFDTYIPDNTNITSITAYWGEDSTNYWSAAATTEIGLGSFNSADWSTIKVDWADTTETGTPTVASITAADYMYLRFDINYGAGQTDDTDFRIDNVRMIRPEKLKFHYNSWAIGQTSATNTTAVYDFTATTNVPLYSGTYDYFNEHVAHKAAAILLRSVGLFQEADKEEAIAQKELERLKRKFPSNRLTETRSFKVLI